MFERTPRSTILYHTTPNFVRVARLDRAESDLLTVSAAAEFEPDDHEGITAWLAQEITDGNGWVAGICGFNPIGAIIFREDVLFREAPRADNLLPMVQRHARNQPEEGWSIGLLNPANGTSLASVTGNHPVLVSAIPRAEIRAFQRQLIGFGVRPRQLELSTLSTLAAIIHYLSLIHI